MRRCALLGALSLAALTALTACDRRRSDPPLPSTETVRIEPATASPPAGDTSVPSAESVFAVRPDVPASGATPTRSNTALSPAQESATMPVAGQANDHSAPLPPAGRASAP